MWSFISYVRRAQLLFPPAILEYLSTGDELQLLSLRPIYLLPQEVLDSCSRQSVWDRDRG